MTASFTVVRTLGRSDVAHDILAELPEWFGTEKYTHEYVEAADRHVNYVAAAVPAPARTASARTVPARTALPAPMSLPMPVPGAPPVAVLPAPTVAVPDALGILLLHHRFPTSAEVHLLAVRRAHHRAGIGRTLLARVEDDLRAQGVRLLSVKTLGPSVPDPDGYDRTRAFYLACGFVPVEEFPDLWADNPCLLLVKVL